MYPANISRAEAAARSAQIGTHGYDVTVDLSGRVPDAGEFDPTATFVSTSTATFTSSGGETWIDVIADRLLAASLDDQPLALDAFDGHRLRFDAAPGEHRLTVAALCRYSHTGEGLHRFVDPVDDLVYCYTQHETADARRLFACFEQPDLKATFTLTVIAPAEWTVLSNSPEVEPVAEDEGLARWRFAPTPGISTYITALVAGRFHLVRDSVQGRAAEIPLSLACRQSLVPHLDAGRILGTTKAGFAVFEEHFGLPYPFADYDQVFVPEFNAGAMENAGCVTIRDEYLYRSRVTDAAHEARDNTILHELAHMWFGDLVTMRWWDDLWLNESFAEWAAHFCQAEIRAASADRDDRGRPSPTAARAGRYRAGPATVHPPGGGRHGRPRHGRAAELRRHHLRQGRFRAAPAGGFRRPGRVPRRRAHLLRRGTRAATPGWKTCSPRCTEASGRDLSHFAAEWLQAAGVNTVWAEFDLDEAGTFSRFAIRQVAPAAWPTLRHQRIAVGLYEWQDRRLVRVHRAEVDIAGEVTELAELVGRATSGADPAERRRPQLHQDPARPGVAGHGRRRHR